MVFWRRPETPGEKWKCPQVIDRRRTVGLFAGGSYNSNLETRYVAFVSATTEHALSMAIFGLISEAKA